MWPFTLGAILAAYSCWIKIMSNLKVIYILILITMALYCSVDRWRNLKTPFNYELFPWCISKRFLNLIWRRIKFSLKDIFPLYSARHATQFQFVTLQRIASIPWRPYFGASCNLFSEDSVTRQKTCCKGKTLNSFLLLFLSGQTEARTCRGKIMNVVK